MARCTQARWLRSSLLFSFNPRAVGQAREPYHSLVISSVANATKSPSNRIWHTEPCRYQGIQRLASSNGTSAVSATLPADLTSLFIDEASSEDYTQHRHSYSEQLFQTISDYCRETVPNLRLALDVGCGPGNSTVGFTKHFKQVIGVDVSETQVARAPRNIPNCEFRVGYSHDLPFLKAGSVDLFCSGLAFNFMPKKETYAEADRVLRPGGTIAIFGHSPPRTNDTRVQKLLQDAHDYLRPRVPIELAHVFDSCRDYELPYSEWIRKDDLVVTHPMSLEGLFTVWRLLQRSISEYAEQKDTEKTIIKHLEKLAAASFPDAKDGTDSQFELFFDTFILMGRKPGYEASTEGYEK